SNGLTTAEADTLRVKWGLNVLEDQSKSKWLILRDQFWAPMPGMIWTVIMLEALLQNWLYVHILLAIQGLNGLVGFFESIKASSAVEALKASLKPNAKVKRDGAWTSITS
ncbi:unnamed protein product, partial [Ectocarpus sp. 12 AP-2014]